MPSVRTCVIVVGLLALAACPATLRAQRPSARDELSTTPSSGTRTVDAFTEPFRDIELAPAEPGVLVSVKVEEGDPVVKGQILGALDSEVLEIGLRIAKLAVESRGRVDAAKAERELRKLRLLRLQELRRKEFAFQDELDRAAADLAVAEANLLSTEEQQAIDALECEKIRAQIERRLIRSPIDGVVAKIHRDEREFVTVMNPSVFTVVQLNPLRAIFNVPTPEALKLVRDQRVRVRLPELDAETEGRVELVSPVSDAESGTVRVKVLVDNGEGKLRAGVRCVLSPGAAPLAEKRVASDPTKR